MALGVVTLGPVLFNWPAERWRDFYFRIADEAPLATVYVGEAVCSKRAPLFVPHVEAVVTRLQAAGKTVVFSTLAQVAADKDRQLVQNVCATDDSLVEANDAAALYRLRGVPHHIGPFVNTYNERAIAVLVGNGATNICLPPELPSTAMQHLSAAAAGTSLEVLIFGRTPLALSARCYHARAHGRTKDNCQFVCEDDPDGLEIRTLVGQPFLVINGIQTLSREFLCLVREIPALAAMGISRFRLSPHSCDMVAVARILQSIVDEAIDTDEAVARLGSLQLPSPFCNGFYHARPGYEWIETSPPSGAGSSLQCNANAVDASH